MRISILQCIYSGFTTFYNVYTVKFYNVATVILQWLYNDAAPPTVNHCKFYNDFTMAALYVLQCIYNDAGPSIVNSM